MQETFGARLRRQREEQHIALITIAEQTKIKLSLLEAMERDDVSHWPAGIFGRAFIRAYGHAIGLNPDDVVREFVEVHPEPADVAAAAAGASAVESERMPAGPPTRLRSIVDSAIGSLSRFRRGSAADDVAVAAAAGAPLSLPPPAEPDLSAAQPCPPAEEPRPENISASIAERERAVAGPDLTAVAHLCTQFGRVENAADVLPLLEKAARILDATGVIVWVWDGVSEELRPALVHGYSDKVLAQLPTVRRGDDNPTAAAFRTEKTRVIAGSDHTNGALVLPLLAPRGCAGALAIELQHGRQLTAPVRAVATILAALLAQLVGGPSSEEGRADDRMNYLRVT